MLSEKDDEEEDYQHGYDDNRGDSDDCDDEDNDDRLDISNWEKLQMRQDNDDY